MAGWQVTKPLSEREYERENTRERKKRKVRQVRAEDTSRSQTVAGHVGHIRYLCLYHESSRCFEAGA